MAAVFITATPVGAIAHVLEKEAAAIIPVLQGIEDWSLLFFEEKKQTFDVHRLTREWMAQNITPSVKVKEWALKAGEYFLSLRNDEGKVHITSLEIARIYFKIAESWLQFIEITLIMEQFASNAGYPENALDLNLSLLPYANETTLAIVKNNIGRNRHR